MELFAVVMTKSSYERTEIKQDLGIEIIHNDKKYTLSENSYGELIFSSLDRSLVILPRAGNSVGIESGG